MSVGVIVLLIMAFLCIVWFFISIFFKKLYGEEIVVCPFCNRKVNSLGLGTCPKCGRALFQDDYLQ